MTEELPPEVKAAAERLASIRVGPIVRQAKLPYVFQAIIDNDKRRHAIMAQPTMTEDDWCELKRLNDDKRHNLRPAAEKALSWNVDKGNPKPRSA